MSSDKLSHDFNVDAEMTLAQNFRQYLTDWNKELNNIGGLNSDACAQINAINSDLKLSPAAIIQKDFILNYCSDEKTECVGKVLRVLNEITAEIDAQKQVVTSSSQLQADTLPINPP